MAKAYQKTNFTTPAGTLAWPKLIEPDTKFTPEGMFQATLVLGAKEAAPLVKILEGYYKAALQEAAQEYGAKKVKPAARPWGPHVRKDGDEETETGEIAFKFKLPHKVKRKDGTEITLRPKIFDRAGMPWDVSKTIGSGTTAKISGSARSWYVKGECGIKLSLEAVQVLVHVAGGRNTAEDYGFGVEAEVPDEEQNLDGPDTDGDDGVPF